MQDLSYAHMSATRLEVAVKLNWPAVIQMQLNVSDYITHMKNWTRTLRIKTFVQLLWAARVAKKHGRK